MDKKKPSNSDLYEKLGRMESRLETILAQVQITNGRVVILEKWRDKIDTIDIYKKELSMTETPKEVDWQKLVLALIGIIGTALAIISYMVQK